MQHTIKKKKARVVTLRFAMLTIFVIMFIFTILFIFEITNIRFKSILLYTSFQLMEKESQSVLKELQRVMKPIALESKLTGNLITEGVLDPNNVEQFIKYTYHLVNMSLFIQGARWSDAHGNYIKSELEEDGTISSKIFNKTTNQKFYHLIRRDKKGKVIRTMPLPLKQNNSLISPWYMEALKINDTVWTNIYVDEQTGMLGMTAATPVWTPAHTLLGVFGLDIKLPYLLKFIEEQKVSPNGFSFIVTSKGKVIAIPAKFIHNKKIGNRLPYLREISPLLHYALKEYKHHHQSHFTIKFDNHIYLFNFKPVPLLEKYDWIIGIIAPETDFTAELEKMHRVTYLLCLIPLILGILLLANFITRIVRPIKYLVQETKKIKKFELDDKIKITSPIKEVIALRDAINGMQKGLRSFQKYVPKTLVQQLIETQEVSKVGGSRKQLVIFFSDIKNFTTIAERQDPNLLMHQMGEYFEALSHIIIEARGTIDKYIGDSIMSFWGAPLAEPHACYYAAYAALVCQKKLVDLNRNWRAVGQPELITRIGIHLGDAIIGNVGSSERLNYTAFGDTINLANRLENINKIYGTKIIVSHTVFSEIKNQFALRFIDHVIISGRRESNCIYELCGEKEEVEFDIEAYREQFTHAFQAYQNQKWDDAIIAFKQCMVIFPKDTLAPLFINRVENFKISPPAEDWKGIWEIVD